MGKLKKWMMNEIYVISVILVLFILRTKQRVYEEKAEDPH